MNRLGTTHTANVGSRNDIQQVNYTHSEAVCHFKNASAPPANFANDAQIVTSDENIKSKSPCEFIGLDGSPLGHQVSHQENLSDEEVHHALDGVSPPPNKKKRNKPYKADQEGDEGDKESKLAGVIADALVDVLCYDEIGGDWYSQQSGLWKDISEKKALKIIMKELNKKLPSGYAISKLNNVKSFLMIYLLLDKWTSNRQLLPMANGVLDTKAMQVDDYSHKHRFNWQLPYAFNPDAKLNVIKRWLWDASGQDIESVNIIRAFFKMALVGGEVQKFLELIGSGGTGKSTLIRLLVAFIGEKNHAATDLKNLETNRFEAGALYGKRLVLISDSSRYGGEVSTLKALTGGDPVRLEKKNVQQSGGSFVFDGVVVIASNEAIQTADYTSGLIRRRMPVNFNRKTTDADKLKWVAVGGIEAVMHKELPGLLNWVMAMSKDEVKAAIGGINGQMTQAQREHLVDTNKIAAWLDDNIVIKQDSVTYVGSSGKNKDHNETGLYRREKLYANYETWCTDNAVHPVALQRFTASIIDVCSQLNIEVIALAKDKHGKPIKGIAIRGDQHFNYVTPVTKKLIGDPEIPGGDPAVTHQSLDSSHGDLDYTKNLSVINTSIEDKEVF